MNRGDQGGADGFGQRQRAGDDALLEGGIAPLQEHVGEQAPQEGGVADRLDPLANGLLGRLGIPGADAAALHQDQTGHPLRRVDGGLQDHAGAHAVPDEDGRWQVQGAQQGDHVGPIGLDVALRRVAGGGAVAAQIAGDHAVPWAEEVELRSPVVVGAGDAVDEDERRLAGPASS